MGFFYDAVYFLFFFGRNRLSSSETTKTPATAFPLNMSPTALGNAAKKFPDVCVSPTPMQNDNETIIIDNRSQNCYRVVFLFIYLPVFNIHKWTQ